MAAALICIIASLVGTTGQAYAGAQLTPGALLYAGQCLTADQGRFQLCMQGDGNLVRSYLGSVGWVPVWSTVTQGNPGTRLQTQYDGNVVLVAPGEHPIWATETNGHPGSYIQVQDDGNIVVYDASAHPLWTSNTNWGTTSGFSADTAAWKIYSADRSVPPYHDSCLDMDINYSNTNWWLYTQAWHCITNQQNQVWHFESAGIGNWVYLKNGTNGECLTAHYTLSPSHNGGNGTPVGIYPCVNQSNQMWLQERIVYPGWPNGLWWRLRNGREPNMCATIDKSSGPVHDGSPVQLSDCLPGYNQINQQWRVNGS